MNIAVVVDERGKTASFNQDIILQIYCKGEEGWHIQKEKAYNLKEGLAPGEITSSLKEIQLWLEACKVLVVKEMKGIFFAFFDRMLFHIWEIDGHPLEYLDYVYDSQIQEQKKQSIQKKPVAPEKIKEGHYYIDLTELMNDENALTTKQVLIPFFKDADFEELLIDCDHVPRWFEKEFPQMNLCVKQQESGNNMKVTVYKKKQ